MYDSAARHDPMARPGTFCRGCDRADPTEMRAYLVTAGHGAGMDVCGHWHAEHATDDYYTACQLVTDLRRAGHVEVSMRHADGHGRYPVVSSVSGPASGACALCAVEYARGTSCPCCGDPMTAWTHRAA